ncbi:MAG TPA: MBL fold metallo-hydrolase [Stellaceae bacterium]|nr:MBL fold metallo-hydrolase [Stellaceae bacterium]
MAQDFQIDCVIIPVTPFQQNCSLLWCKETMRGAVVDPGGDVDRIMDAIRTRGVTVEKILITHAHVDHAGGAADLAERLGVPIEGPQREDQFWIDRIQTSAAEYRIPNCRAFTPTRWLEDGDKVTVGNLEFDVRHVPGHTPGHVVFFDAADRLAFVGDTLFQGSIGRTDFPRGDHQALLDAIVAKLWPMGDDVTFVPGHGAASTIGRERATNPYVADKVLGRS